MHALLVTLYQQIKTFCTKSQFVAFDKVVLHSIFYLVLRFGKVYRIEDKQIERTDPSLFDEELRFIKVR